MGVFFMCLMIGCSKESAKPPKKFVSIGSEPFSTILFYSGMIEPLTTKVITSPADGVILDMLFQYGEKVKKGDLLFTLFSIKFQTEYKTALMAYIKAKNDYNNSKTQLEEAKFLHQNELISNDDYKSKQANFYANQLAFLQAKDTLRGILKQLNITDDNLFALSIADTSKIAQALHLKTTAENLPITSPATGIILSPRKSEDESKKVQKGDPVKQGDVLGIIGDMSGISVRIKVNELTINQLKLGQKVRVTGIAFADEVLTGEVIEVDRQGESSGGNIPTFSVKVIVPLLSPLQKQVIHVGMSAKVEINLNEKARISVPIAAIMDKNGESYVERLNPKTHTTEEVLVKTGQTSPDAIAILSSNLKIGDQIAITH